MNTEERSAFRKLADKTLENLGEISRFLTDAADPGNLLDTDLDTCLQNTILIDVIDDQLQDAKNVTDNNIVALRRLLNKVKRNLERCAIPDDELNSCSSYNSRSRSPPPVDQQEEKPPYQGETAELPLATANAALPSSPKVPLTFDQPPSLVTNEQEDIQEQGNHLFQQTLAGSIQPTAPPLPKLLEASGTTPEQKRVLGRGRGRGNILRNSTAPGNAQLPIASRLGTPIYSHTASWSDGGNFIPPGQHFEAPFLQSMPIGALDRYGGVPAVYVSPGANTPEWPVVFEARITGMTATQWTYLDRHCPVSLIGADVVPSSARPIVEKNKTHINIPWKGRGDPYWYSSYVDLPVCIGEQLVLQARFAIVAALDRSVIFGHDFVTRNCVWIESRDGIPFRANIRNFRIPCQLARRAWQVPDSKGGFKPRRDAKL